MKIKLLKFVKKVPKQIWIFFGVTALSVIILFLTVDLTPHVDGDFFFSSDDPKFQYDKLISKVFPEQATQVIISVEGDIESDDYLDKIELLTSVISYVPGVAGVKSLAEGPKNVKDALDSPFWKRLLISDDGKASNLIVLVEDDTSPQDVIPRLENSMAVFNDRNFQTKIAGLPYVVEIIRRNLLRDLRTFSTLAFIIFGIMIIFIFKSGKILIGTMISCIDACVITLIISTLFGVKIGILTVNLSTIVFVLTLSHIVFLTHNWRDLIQDQETPLADYTKEAVQQTFKASFWCMVTTLLGFLSLLFVQAKPLRELGISGSIGTLVAIAVAYLIYPLFLRLVKPIYRREEDIREDKIRKFLMRHSRRIIIGILVLFVIAFAGLWRLNTDPSLFSYFKKGRELRNGLEYIDRNGGSSPLKLVLRDAEGNTLNTGKTYQKLWQVQEALEKDESVGSIISLPVIMAEGGRNPLAFLISWERLLKIMEQPKYNRIAKSFVTDDRYSGFFMLRMRESVRTTSRIDVVNRIKGIVMNTGFVPEMVGGIFLLQGELSRLVSSSLIYGLGRLVLFFVVIAWIVSRSIKTSLGMVLSLSVIPVCMLGIVGLLRVPLDIISAPAANVAIAMGIDAMIHIVFFVRRQLSEGAEIKEAWIRAQKRLWDPVLGSVLIISAGFGIFSLSSFPPTQRFGISIVFGTILSGLTAIFILPLLAQLASSKKPQAVFGDDHEILP